MTDGGPTDFERAFGAGFARAHHPALAQVTPWQGTVEPGWDVNFLGVKTRVSYFSLFERLADFSATRQLQTMAPVVNEDYFEWIDLLEAVSTARGVFRMVELGAGWGKWLSNGIAAARLLGLDYSVVGVEAEPKHFEWMREHLVANDVDLTKTDLVRAAVASEEGEVWFHVGDAADWYGQRIEEVAPEPPRPSSWRQSLARRHRRTQGRQLVSVPAVSLESLLSEEDVIDLIDSDIQGSEADVFEAGQDRLDACVKRVHIGTHSDDNEDRLRRLFGLLDWENVNDFPCGRASDTPYGRLSFEDGVQTWVNPKFAGGFR